MYGLEGRNAIVTGAAHGIGRAIATRFASEGCHVGILDHDAAAAQAIGAAIAGNGGAIRIAVGNVASKPEAEAGIALLTAELGTVDILVNNAGILRSGKLLEMSDADWSETFRVNVDGLFHVTRAVVPGMVARRSGAVVNMTSWMGKSGVAHHGAYCASKFAIVALTQALATEIGEYGVRVNAVAPGLIVGTKMREKAELDRRAKGLELAESRAKSIPLRRTGLPEDIANAVAFLCSDQAAYVTGETVSVTGGLWND
jgi:NAD(P)-dependent dehydrogenase (short-subunit alcohol dehydrogenase family)